MVALRVLTALFVFFVIAQCQRGKKVNYPQSPFLKGGKRRDHVLAQNGGTPTEAPTFDNNAHKTQSKTLWPGSGRDHGHNHNEGHKHIQGIKLPRGNGRGIGGSCGDKPYAARSHICCGGTIKRRQGMRPACCGTDVFDFVFDLCCEGRITKRTVSRPTC